MRNLVMKSLVCCILLCVSFSSHADIPSQKQLDGLFQIIRDRKPGNSPGSVSDETINAANQVFSSVAFIHKTLAETVILLGKPSEVTKSESERIETITYTFDSGYGGWSYKLTSRGDHIFKVEAIGID